MTLGFSEIYKQCNFALAENVMKRHLWYLSDQVVGRTLFSDNVSHETKLNMVKSLKKKASSKKQNKCRYEDNLHQKSLDQFVTSETGKLLKMVRPEYDHSFLEDHPSTWNTNGDYIICKQRVQAINVINDCAVLL